VATAIDVDETNHSAAGAGAVYLYTRAGSTWSQQTYVKASNTGVNDRFGASLALSADGNAMAVGAGAGDGGTTGVNGDQSSNAATDSGSVYLY